MAILKQLFGEGLRAIEHVGSTSFYGMSAKPTIDIVADIAFPGEFEGLVEQLSSIEYLFAPNPVCAVFRKGPADMVLPRGVHLHVCTEGSRLLAADRRRQRAGRFEQEPGRYTEGKRSFVKEVGRRIEAPGPPPPVHLRRSLC